MASLLDPIDLRWRVHNTSLLVTCCSRHVWSVPHAQKWTAHLAWSTSHSDFEANTIRYQCFRTVVAPVLPTCPAVRRRQVNTSNVVTCTLVRTATHPRTRKLSMTRHQADCKPQSIEAVPPRTTLTLITPTPTLTRPRPRRPDPLATYSSSTW